MKLSEAIRLGSMSLRPVTNRFATYETDDDGLPCAACTIGAAAWAVGLLDAPKEFWEGPWTGALADRFPILNLMVPWPEPNAHLQALMPRNVGQIASAMFVGRHWTREQIADWVDGIERAQDTLIGCADQAAMEPALALQSAAQK